MTHHFQRLARMELRLFLRQPLTWLVLAALFAAMLIGAQTGATRRAAQEQTIERLIAQEQGSVQLAREAARRYASPSELKLEYHRDPTDAFGYMNYFLVTHAYKLPAPLAELAVGQSDLLPYYERVDFTTVLANGAYEPENPGTLAAGSFDLAFVLIYLVPLGVIALAGMRLSGEHDSGVLRMIAAHPIKPWQVAVAKFAGPALVTAGLVVVLTFVSLSATGSPRIHIGALPAVSLVVVALAGYVLLWFAAAAVVATLWRGAVMSVVILVSAWIGATLIIPAAAALTIGQLAPPPSRIGYVDASREAMDAFYADEARAYAAYLSARPKYAAVAPTLLATSALKRFARDEAYRAPLRDWEQRFESHQTRVNAFTSWLRIVSPVLMMDGVLQAAAGTDALSYQRFAQRSREYASDLRKFFEPIALGNAVRGEKWSCGTCPGRLNFTDYERVPRYVPDEPSSVITGITLIYAGVIWLAAALLTLVAARRLREWPV